MALPGACLARLPAGEGRMKAITEAHLESWRQSRPALLEVVEQDTGRKDGLTVIHCLFGNPMPNGPAISERYLLARSDDA
jgi:hypothetical protein